MCRQLPALPDADAAELRTITFDIPEIALKIEKCKGTDVRHMLQAHVANGAAARVANDELRAGHALLM